MPAIVVMTTAPNIEEAESLAEKIVGAKLAACVQVMPEMKSFYFWEGAVKKQPEHLLLIKTLPEKYELLHLFILENHSYDVPEIISLNASEVSETYLDWLNDYLTW
jgi:periplasmic divalent cation tolerance protein